MIDFHQSGQTIWPKILSVPNPRHWVPAVFPRDTRPTARFIEDNSVVLPPAAALSRGLRSRPSRSVGALKGQCGTHRASHPCRAGAKRRRTLPPFKKLAWQQTPAPTHGQPAGRGRAALLRSPNYFRAAAACRIEAERRRTAPPCREPAYLIAI